MANSISNAGLNAMLDALAALLDQASLHSSFPSLAGSNEISGGSYARQSITWNSAASGALDSSNQDRRRIAARPRHQVQHLVNAVAKVHVPHAPRLKKDFRAQSASTAGMARQIRRTVVRLNFHNAPGQPGSVGLRDEEPAEQTPRQLHGVVTAECRCGHKLSHPGVL